MASYVYESYGRILNQNGSGTTSEGKPLYSENPFKYASYFRDQETNYYYLMARYYNGAQGRFLTADSLTNANLYYYVENDPVNKTDPLGNAWYSSVWKNAKKFLNKTWSGVKWISGYSDVRNFVNNPSWKNAVWALTAIPFFKWGKLGKLFSGVKNSSRTFSGGKAGEVFLAKLVGGRSQVYFRTSRGGRYIDQLTNGIAHESKVGYTSLTKSVKGQIMKDVALINSKDIKGAEWYFFRSADTGKIGATKPLLEFLTKNGIKYKIHY